MTRKYKNLSFYLTNLFPFSSVEKLAFLPLPRPREGGGGVGLAPFGTSPLVGGSGLIPVGEGAAAAEPAPLAATAAWKAAAAAASIGGSGGNPGGSGRG